uniref:Uncharacterized protein n=1 Tax=Micrurus corallinus TaxID=54390 RepID=A0A2D4GF06_MICCO
MVCSWPEAAAIAVVRFTDGLYLGSPEGPCFFPSADSLHSWVLVHDTVEHPKMLLLQNLSSGPSMRSQKCTCLSPTLNASKTFWHLKPSFCQVAPFLLPGITLATGGCHKHHDNITQWM